MRLLIMMLLAACGPAPECTTRIDCEDGFSCVNQRCEPRLLLDAGDRDAGDRDAGDRADAGADAAVCARTCGDVDLDRDGDRDDDDFDALSAAVSDPCVLTAADADLDGDYDEVDEHALRALAGGDALGPCGDCGGCGDVDADGAVDADDVTLAAAAIGTTPTICTFVAADIDRDGDVDQEDAWLIEAAADGRATIDCAACDPDRACGDYSDDSVVSVLDASGVIAAFLGGTVLAQCTHLAADVVRDGVVDRRDAFGIARTVAYASAPELESCAPCVPNLFCADVNGDGGVNAGDSVAIRNIGLEDPGNICRRARADVNGDGAINDRDSNIVRDLTLMAATGPERCPLCSTVCGDVDGDGVAGAPDTARLAAIRGGDPSTICERDLANANGDVTIDDRDTRLVGLLASGRVVTSGPCGVCRGICGDANQDGIVTASDRGVVTSIIDTPRLPTACEMDDADVDFDGDVDAADRDGITAIIGGTPPAMPCGR